MECSDCKNKMKKSKTISGNPIWICDRCKVLNHRERRR